MGNEKIYIEKLDSISGEIKIINRGLKITEDTLFLANTVKKFFLSQKFGDKKNMLEIGAGQGIISILLSQIDMISNISAVEIQREIYCYLEENVSCNKLGNKILPINKDIKDVEGSYDIIISNPPYNKLNSGKLPINKSELISKYEEKLTLEELIYNIKRLLKNYGIFFIVIPNKRLNDVFNYIYKNKLNIITLEIKKFKNVDIVVIIGKKGGKYKSGINLFLNI